MNKYLLKIAEKIEKDRPHQESALKQLERTNGLLLDHSPGSGKTRLYIRAIQEAQKKDPTGRSLVIAPASLTTNLQEQAKKLNINIDMSKVDSHSYEWARAHSDDLKKNKYLLAIADEAHRLRNFDTSTHKELEDVFKNSHQRILGTGTTTYNHAHDIAPLVNLAAGKEVLPVGKAFDNEFVDKHSEQPSILKRIMGASPIEVQKLKNKNKLSKVLKQHVNYYNTKEDASMKDKFPTEHERIIEVPMDSTQETIYKYLEGRLPFPLRMKVRMNLPLSKKESSQLNSFSSGVRQVSNSAKPFLPQYDHISPKVKAMVDSLHEKHINDKNFKGIVYSNYLEGGLKDYSRELTDRGITHSLYTGSMSKKEKDRAKDDYNSGKNKVMLISSSGAEGLDLKGTKLVQVMEPHHNDSKIKQVLGRGSRYGSHEALPEKERHVEFERYHSVFKPGMFGKAKSHSIDQYLHHHSKSKDELSEEIKDLMRDNKK